MEVPAAMVQPADHGTHEIWHQPQLVESTALKWLYRVLLAAHGVTTLSGGVRFCNWHPGTLTLYAGHGTFLSAALEQPAEFEGSGGLI
jgi:hypothetical protein